jgi:NAD(P)-dependent dehydrogenase (short-subunit alcohol dehydrogenase family)
MRLEGKRAVITGGASGLGAAIARRFTAEGATVVLIDLPRASERGEALVAEGSAAHFVAGDVLDANSIRSAIDRAAEAMGGVQLCVASAGVSGHPSAGFRGLLDLEPEHYDFVQNVNTRGVFLTVQRSAQLMIASGNGGAMLTLASVASKRPTAGAYSVSKAAVWMLTRAMALELAPHGIRINAIGPGYVSTEMLAGIAASQAGPDEAAQEAWYESRRTSAPLGVLPTPEDIAATALFLCSDDAATFTGSLLHPDGGLTAQTGGG